MKFIALPAALACLLALSACATPAPAPVAPAAAPLANTFAPAVVDERAEMTTGSRMVQRKAPKAEASVAPAPAKM